MTLNITILCKVVDNYGDIGFVYRLSRAISRLEKNATLRLVVSNLESFKSMAPDIDSSLSVQEYCSWQVLDWNDADACTNSFIKDPPKIILQCFQCGRPEWLDEILFCKERNVTKQIVNIINVEYLTAESWADDFHLLKSATRSSYVKKINFMPGFTNKTAGLILEEPKNESCLLDFFSKEDIQDLNNKDTFCVVVFAYQKDFFAEVNALQKFQSKMQQKNPCFKVHVFVATGLSMQNFINAWQSAKEPFMLTKLPYLPQYAWDTLLTVCDWSFIRGEDSFSRSCLAGKPFVWHAYQQENEFQLVKVQAFLLRLKPFLCQEDFNLFAWYSLIYSRRFNAELCQESKESIDLLLQKDLPCTQEQGQEELEKTLFLLLDRYQELKQGFYNFAQSLKQNGDFAKNLLDYIKVL